MNKKAFSLVELSIVLLIIGIVITGIVGSSRLVTQFRLKNAQTQSQSGPVSSIPGLILWLDSTHPEAFDKDERADGSAVTNWYSHNSQGLERKVLSKASGAEDSTRPIYDADGINNLPALEFNGKSQYLQVEQDAELNPPKMTVIVAIKPDGFGIAHQAIISSRDDFPSKGYILYITPNNSGGNEYGYTFWVGGDFGWSTSLQIAPVFNEASVVSAYADDVAVPKLFYNGGEASVGSGGGTSFNPNYDNNMRIGAGSNENPTAGYFFDGHIGEVIMFNRKLKNSERESIESYLYKKWRVDI